MEKKIFRTGIVTFSILLVLTVVFYKTHSVLLDNSFFLFDMLRRDSFAIHHSRYIAVFTQLLTYASMKLSFPLNIVAISYSSAFILFYFACFLVTGIMLKNYRLAICLFLINVLIITDTFFWQLSEIMQGIALMMPIFAVLIDSRKANTILHYILLIAGVITVSFAHPLMAFPFIFTCLFILFSNNIHHDKKLVIGVAILFIVAAVIKRVYFSDAYEVSSMKGMSDRGALMFDFFKLYATKQFVKQWVHTYYWIPVSLVLITVVYINTGSWSKLLLVLAFFSGYLLLINVSYPTDYTPKFYMENLYIPLSVFLVFPLVFDVFPALSQRDAKLPLVMTILITLSCFYRINRSHNFFENRLDWYRNYLAENKGKKQIVPFNNVPKSTVLMSWGSPYEIWLLSTLETDTTASVIISDEMDAVSWAWGHHKEFITTWGIFKYEEFSPAYFKFYDTVRNYDVIPDTTLHK